MKMSNLKKKKRGRMIEHNPLIPSYNRHKMQKYLNISASSKRGAGVAEWLLQPLDTGCPSGLVGSIPTPGADNLYLTKLGGVNNSIRLFLSRMCVNRNIIVNNTLKGGDYNV